MHVKGALFVIYASTIMTELTPTSEGILKMQG
jgi:hypothetical protein